MKGRLKHSKRDYNAKHRLLLTAKLPVVQLRLEKAHPDNLHEGTECVINTIQQEYWIIGLRNALTKSSREVSNADTGKPIQFTHRCQLARERLDGVPIHSYRSRLLRTV